MSFGLRTLARLITVIAVVTTYITLHLAITVGTDLRDRDHFREAPTRAAAFVAALDRYANGEVSARAEILMIDAWFEENAPLWGNRYLISSATDYAKKGEFSIARRYIDDLAVKIDQNQAALDRDLRSSSATALQWAAAAGVFIVLSLWLRHRRGSGVTEIVEVVSQFVPHQPWWRRPVFLAVTWIGYVVLTTGFVALFPPLQQIQQIQQMQLEVRGLFLLGGGVTLGAGVLILCHSRPRSARGATQALLADGRQPVLYLRSFGDDHTAAQVDGHVPYNILSREEQLSWVLSAFGPVITVGKPGEPLPHLGAARFYLPYDDWQPAVRRLMELSQLIVLRLGAGKGLWWEVEQARTTQPARKLVLLVPGQRAGVADRLDEHLPTPARLNEVTAGDYWISAVIAFDPKWTPYVCPVGPVPGTKAAPDTPWRHMTRHMKAVRSSMRHVACAMDAVLASVGFRKRAIIWRANIGMLAMHGKALLLVSALVSALVLLGRALQLFSLW